MNFEIPRRVWRSVQHAVSPYPVRDLPVGRRVMLPGRGETFVTDSGPRDAPAVFLMHSVLTTGTLCWYPVIPELNSRYRVISMDVRWHGRGIRSERFDLDDAADDVVALADVLGIDRFTVAGFSMGGGIAQLVWRRHSHRVDGLVLCSTGPFFSERDPRNQVMANRIGSMLAPLYRLLPTPSDAALDRPGPHPSVWAIRQFLSTPLSHFGSFGEGLGRFDSTGWLGEIDVPTAVVVSTHDRVVSPARQELLLAVPGARRFDVAGGHACCVIGAEAFIEPFGHAVDAVVDAAAGARLA